MKEAQNLEGHRSFVVVAFILNKKPRWHSVPWVWVGSCCPRGNMHNENKAWRITTHVTCTTSIYVHNILRENSDEWIKCTPPPPFWFCSKWIIKWNTQTKVVRSTFDMVHWFFSAFLDINHKNTNYFLVYNWSHTAKLNNCRHASPRDFEAYRRNKGRTFTFGLFTALLGEPVTKELKTSPCRRLNIRSHTPTPKSACKRNWLFNLKFERLAVISCYDILWECLANCV